MRASTRSRIEVSVARVVRSRPAIQVHRALAPARKLLVAGQVGAEVTRSELEDHEGPEAIAQDLNVLLSRRRIP
jgi:hypothetical protein